MNLNKAFILGNLTRDPELRQTSTGQSVASFGVATNRIWKDQSGNKQTQAEFHNVVVWGRLAEIASQYLSKGALVFIEGRISTRSWQDQQGQKKYRTEIVAENMQLGPRNFPGQAQNNREAPARQEYERETLPEVQLEDIGINNPPAVLESVNKTGEEEIKVEDIPF